MIIARTAKTAVIERMIRFLSARRIKRSSSEISLSVGSGRAAGGTEATPELSWILGSEASVGMNSCRRSDLAVFLFLFYREKHGTVACTGPWAVSGPIQRRAFAVLSLRDSFHCFQKVCSALSFTDRLSQSLKNGVA